MAERDGRENAECFVTFSGRPAWMICHQAGDGRHHQEVIMSRSIRTASVAAAGIGAAAGFGAALTAVGAAAGVRSRPRVAA